MRTWIIKQSPLRSRESVSYRRIADDLICQWGDKSETVDLSGDWAVIEPDEQGNYDSLGLISGAYRDNGTTHITVRTPFLPGQYVPASDLPLLELTDGETLAWEGEGDA